jgi:hypothetical protein
MLQDITASILAMALIVSAVEWFAGWCSRRWMGIVQGLKGSDCVFRSHRYLWIAVTISICVRPCWLDTVCVLDGWNEGQVIFTRALTFWAYDTERQRPLFGGIQADTKSLVFGDGQLSVRIQNMAACSDRSLTGPAQCPAVHRYFMMKSHSTTWCMMYLRWSAQLRIQFNRN